MEFKITHETTLYELQEYCKEQAVDCYTCVFRDDNTESGCYFGDNVPMDWNIKKPKTYKEDFLEKFPNAEMDCGVPVSCRINIYTDDKKCCYECAKCWNEIMKEVED